MKQTIKTALFALVFVGSVVASSATASAIGVSDGSNAAAGKDQRNAKTACIMKGQKYKDINGAEQVCPDGIISTVTNVLLFIIGAISVIMIVIGGIKYTTSNGDSSAVTSAKNTILYAVVGLVLALLAYAVINFVVGQFISPVEG
jgi:hypothetical protein